MKIIGFSGVDSLGKTYYSNLIKAELEKLDFKVKTLHYFDYSISKYLLPHHLPNENNKKNDLSYKPFFVNIRYLILFIDLIVIKSFIFAKKFNYDFLILDRTYIDYKLNIKYLKNKNIKKIKIKILLISTFY